MVVIGSLMVVVVRKVWLWWRGISGGCEREEEMDFHARGHNAHTVGQDDDQDDDDDDNDHDEDDDDDDDDADDDDDDDDDDGGGGGGDVGDNE